MQYTNNLNISIAAAVMLVRDTYDHDVRKNSISATGILKPLKQVIMSSRTTTSNVKADVADKIPTAFGTAVHDSIHAAWLDNPQKALLALGWSEDTVKNVVINPTKEELTEDSIPVYLELREEKQLGDFIVTGKFDFIGNGQLTDHKTTSVYGYLKKDKIEDYVLQGSIYRWLNPDIITENTVAIDYWFTDWSKLDSIIKAKNGYPSARVLTEKYPLLSIEETEKFLQDKWELLNKYMNCPEEDLPPCTQKELWQDPPKFKYYKNPEKTKKSTANFDTFTEAQIRYTKDGEVGKIVEVVAKAKRCNWCNGVSVCKQAQQLVRDGLLVIDA